jgi:multiple sugar transport system substrate-binding protein
MRDSTLLGNQYNVEQVFPLATQKLSVYGGRTMALPISVQVPFFGYRDAWLEASDNSPPHSWQEYHELLSRVNDSPTVFPARASLTSWPAIMLLARAAAYACHPQHESLLFDAQTMEPLIAEEPFVRAMEEWRQEALWAGPKKETAAGAYAAVDEPSGRHLWAELPGAERVFNRSTGEWEALPNGVRRVPLLSDGWLVAVTTSTRNAASAFKLAAWLASSELSAQLSPAFKTMLPCRRALLSAARRRADSSIWMREPGIAKAFESALNHSDALVVPRIPGVDQYLATLSEAVENALRGTATSNDALQAAARQWNQITDQLGRDTQRRAYLAHLNIAEP